MEAFSLPRLGDRRGVYTVLVGKTEGMRRLVTPRRRCVDNVEMDLQEGGKTGAWTGWIWLRIRTGGGHV